MAGLGLALWAAVGTGRLAAQSVPLGVQTVKPQRGEITRFITLPGNVRYQRATLYAKVAGYLKSISVDKGDRKKARCWRNQCRNHRRPGKFKAEVGEIRLRPREAQSKAPDWSCRNRR